MSDQTLICKNCTNEFVFSAGEQSFYASKSLANPKYCPICRSIKHQESQFPVKPIPPSVIPASSAKGGSASGGEPESI
ncbi:zinc-ribbon domain-containing protein [Candidatus Collierbacteria bacterium]|nr:zinc-ribbon domain-containing protein [Candidatus Collierbacteria bacterium]